jgi:CRISPR-associated protein Cmr1
MNQLTFNCEVITPLFMSGADGITPELRAASIKGVMRFWWRAMNGDRPDMREREVTLFGGTAGDSGGLRSKVLIRLIEKAHSETDKNFIDIKTKTAPGRRSYPTNILHYLAYGLTSYERERGTYLTKQYFIPNQSTKFDVKITCPVEFEHEIKQLFYVISRFGGFGARSRNGYGSVEISNTQKIANTDLKIGAIKPFHAFSKDIQIYNTKRNDFKTWEEALANVGNIYKIERERLEDKHHYEKRSVLSAPITVRDAVTRQSNNEAFLERHSKPIFLSVHKSTNGYFGTLLVMPYNYLEGHPNIKSHTVVSHQSDYNKMMNTLKINLSKNSELQLI